MQMRKMYLTTNRQIRIQQLLQAADECEAAGVHGLARVNREMAAWISPRPVYRDDSEE